MTNFDWNFGNNLQILEEFYTKSTTKWQELIITKLDKALTDFLAQNSDNNILSEAAFQNKFQDSHFWQNTKAFNDKILEFYNKYQSSLPPPSHPSTSDPNRDKVALTRAINTAASRIPFLYYNPPPLKSEIKLQVTGFDCSYGNNSNILDEIYEEIKINWNNKIRAKLTAALTNFLLENTDYLRTSLAFQNKFQTYWQTQDHHQWRIDSQFNNLISQYFNQYTTALRNLLIQLRAYEKTIAFDLSNPITADNFASGFKTWQRNPVTSINADAVIRREGQIFESRYQTWKSRATSNSGTTTNYPDWIRDKVKRVLTPNNLPYPFGNNNLQASKWSLIDWTNSKLDRNTGLIWGPNYQIYYNDSVIDRKIICYNNRQYMNIGGGVGLFTGYQNDPGYDWFDWIFRNRNGYYDLPREMKKYSI